MVSGSAAAALALATLWLVIATGQMLYSRFPMHRSWIVMPGSAGLIIYPICWYALIFNTRDYSVRKTWLLISRTYVVCCVVGIVMVVGLVFYYLATQTGAQPPPQNEGLWSRLFWSIIAPPLLAVFYVGMLSLLLAIPFFAVAAPIAFLHRAFLLGWFARGSDQRTRQ